MKIQPDMADCLTGTESYRDILFSPKDPTREFILDGCTYDGVYRLAAGICRLQPISGKSRASICLCTDDKTLMAAGLLASLVGGPLLVLPYAFSRQAVDEVMEILPLSFLLADAPGDFPSGPEVITPDMLRRDCILPDTFRDPDEPFLTLFTGGSTGKSKAWSKTPRNVLAEALYLSNKFGISSDDIFLSTVPPRHIYGLLHSVLIPFINSARVLDGIYTFPREILRAAYDYKASVLVSVPVHYRVLKVDDLQRHDLRIAFSSTGVLDEEDAAYFHNKTGVDITEIYGSTETGGVAARNRLSDGESWRSLEPVGWKILGGRLHVRSAFISPELPLDEDGFFTTADRADPYKNCRFILQGRADDIVKIGGKRVDLAAVQNKIKQIPGVRDAVVIAIPTVKGRQNELAAVVATHIGALQLRRHIAAISEAYAVPRRIAVVEEIPVAFTGKYDRAGVERILRSIIGS
jgi:acyl-coenzyme A synthetase/AMP-(fatty) acid ligase